MTCRLQLVAAPAAAADVSGLHLYLHNVKFTNKGVLLAPRAAIRNTHIEMYR